jgi:hypothetical protein
MSCPYFKESYFAICVVPNAIHIPTIDEMERLCFRSSYRNCPNIARMEDPETSEEECSTSGLNKLSADPAAWPSFADTRGRTPG